MYTLFHLHANGYSVLLHESGYLCSYCMQVDTLFQFHACRYHFYCMQDYSISYCIQEDRLFQSDANGYSLLLYASGYHFPIASKWISSLIAWNGDTLSYYMQVGSLSFAYKWIPIPIACTWIVITIARKWISIPISFNLIPFFLLQVDTFFQMHGN